MKGHLLDTNTVSHLLRGHPVVAKRVLAVPMVSIFISSITEGELLFGLAKRPLAARLHLVVKEFLRRVEVKPWDSMAADHYAVLRAEMENRGQILSPLDLLIASHALSLQVTLVTNDKAFSQLTDLCIEDWTD